MNAFRIAVADAFPGQEPKPYAGRWHLPGDVIIYLASTAAGAILERIAHAELDSATLEETVWLLWRYEAPADLQIDELPAPPNDWQSDWPACQQMTRNWHASGPAGLWVPSAVAHTEKNLLLRPDRIREPFAVTVERFRPDRRLINPGLRRFGSP